MPCKKALIDHPITIDGDLSIDEAVTIANQNGLRNLPVITEDGLLEGMFGTHALLYGLLPASARMGDSSLDDLSFTKGESPDLAFNLDKIRNETVRKYMDTDIQTATLDTPIWEGIRLLVKHGSPLAIIDKETNKFEGLISEQSVLGHLEALNEELKN